MMRSFLSSAILVLGLVAPLTASTQPLAAPTLGNPTPPAAPVNPFFASLDLTSNDIAAAGPASGKLAVTNLTLTNFDSSPQQVFIFAPVVARGSCSGKVVGGSFPRLVVIVQAGQTLVIPYPTALVFQNLHPNCIAAELLTVLNGGSVELEVTGFVQ